MRASMHDSRPIYEVPRARVAIFSGVVAIVRTLAALRTSHLGVAGTDTLSTFQTHLCVRVFAVATFRGRLAHTACS